MIARWRRFADSGRQANFLAVVVVVGVLLRLVWGLWAQRKTPGSWQVSGDQYGYWYYANEISHGRGYRSYITGEATAYYPVGYPAILGMVYLIGRYIPGLDNQATLTVLFHTALAGASIVLVYFIGRKILDHRVGLIAATIFALFPSLVIGVATFAVEPMFIFSALLVVAIAIDHDWSAGPMTRRRLLWFGVALGGSALVRPFALPVLLGLGVAAFCAARRGDRFRSVLRHMLWPALTLIVVLVPWTVRNEVRFSAFVPISTNLGDTLCMSRFPGSGGGFAWSTHEYCADSNLPEAERNPANTRAAIGFIRDHPVEEMRQMVRRFRLTMANDHYTLTEVTSNDSVAIKGSLRQFIDFVSDSYYYLICAAALLGLVELLRNWRRDSVRGPRRAVVGIAGLGLIAIPTMLWGNPRFHTPLLPFLALPAAAALSWAYSEVRRTGTRAPLQASTVGLGPTAPV